MDKEHGESQELVSSTAKINFWKPYVPESGQGGFGFVTVVNQEKGSKESAYIRGMNVVPSLKEGESPKVGQNIYFLDEHIAKGDRGLRLTLAFQSKEALMAWKEDQLQLEKIVRERTLRVENDRKNREESERKIQQEVEKLSKILDRIREVYPGDFGEVNILNKASEAVIPVSLCQILYRYTATDNDMHGKDFKPLEFRESEIVLKGTYYADNLGAIPPNSERVLVEVKANVQITDSIVKTEKKSDIGGYKVRSSYEVDAGKETTKSRYYVSLEDAQKIWQNIEWWRLSESDLAKAVEIAQKVLQTRDLWEQLLPDIPVGDLEELKIQAGLRSFDTEPNSWEWIRSSWRVPQYLTRPLEELLTERHQHLLVLAKAGDSEAQESLSSEARNQLRWDIWTTFPNLIGKPWDTQEFDYYAGHYSTEDINKVPEGMITIYRAIYKNPETQEIQELVRTYVGYTMREGYPYYRFDVKNGDLQPPYTYEAGSLVWEKVD